MQAVEQLPVEVVPRNVEERGPRTAAAHRLVAAGLAPHVQMRHESHDRGVERQPQRRLLTVVGSARWNRDPGVYDAGHAHLVPRRLLCIDHAHSGAIGRRRSVGRVVHLKLEPCPLRQFLGEAFGIDEGVLPRHIFAPESAPLLGGGIPRAIRLFLGASDMDERVVHHVAIARLHLDRPHPAILGETRLDEHRLIGHYPRRLHRYRLGELEDGVRGADLPAVRIRLRRRCIGRISLGSPAGNPPQQVTFLRFCERSVVGPGGMYATGLGVGGHGRRKPGRHGATIDHLSHHAGVGHKVVVGVKRERTDATVAVALGAVSLHDSRNATVVCHLRDRGITRRHVQHAARRLGGRDKRGLPGTDGRQRVGEVSPARRFDRVAEPVLIVDRAVVGDRAVAPQHHGIRRGDRADGRRQPAFRIVHVGRPGAKPAGGGLHIGQLVGCHRVDEDPRDAVPVGRDKFLEPRQILAADRTTRARHGKDHDPRVCNRGERV